MLSKQLHKKRKFLVTKLCQLQHNFWNLEQAALIFSRRCLHEALFDDKTNVQHVAADCARTQFSYRWNFISSLENRFSRV